MSALGVLQQRAFETGRFDVGNLTQAVWSTAHGRFLEITDLQGEQISRLGAHFDPLVVLLAPRWWLWPHPSLLLVVQAVGVVARRRARVPARPQAPRLGLGGPRIRARLPPLPTDAVARGRRLPPGRARNAAAPRRDLVPRRGPAAAVRALRRGGVPDEGAGRARGRDAGHLARSRPRAPPRGRRDRDPRRRDRRRRDRGDRAALRRRRRVAVRRTLRRGRRLAPRHRQDGGDPSAAPGRGSERASRPRLPRGPARSPRRPAASFPAPGRIRRARARAEPPLRNAHPDLDPLPLHRGSHPGPGRRCRARSAARAAPMATIGRAARALPRRPRRMLGRAARAAPRLAARSLRLGARHARPHRDRPRSRSRACARRRAAGCRRQRHEHARGTSLRAAPCLQLPRARGGAVGRSRSRAAELPRRRPRSSLRNAHMRLSGGISAGRSSAPRTASSCFAADPDRARPGSSAAGDTRRGRGTRL